MKHLKFEIKKLDENKIVELSFNLFIIYLKRLQK